MKQMVNQLKQFFRKGLWEADLDSKNGWHTTAIKSLQIGYALRRDIRRSQLSLYAMSLVYTSLLSMVPLLAVSFSVLKAFGVHNQIEPLLQNFLLPLGEKGQEITTNIIAFVENMKVGVLGSIGLIFLFYTVFSLVQKIENAFNHIWHNAPTRSFLRQFSDYLSIILMGPVLIFSGIGLTAAMMNNTIVQKIISIESLSGTTYFFGQTIPYFLIMAIFTFIYIFIPNTKVKFYSALIGGITAGILWKLAGLAFSHFAATSSNYDAIYSSFAILIMFMIWIYLSWLILLLGAQITFYCQNPQLLHATESSPQLSMRYRERVSLLVMQEIANHYYYGESAPTLQQLTDKLNIPSSLIKNSLDTYEKDNLLVRTLANHAGYVPAQAMTQITIADILNSIRCTHEDTVVMYENSLYNEKVEAILKEIEQSYGVLETRTLEDLVTPKKKH